MANSVVNQVKVGSTTYDMKPYLGSATSGDAASATAWTAVDAVATSDSYDTVFNKVTKMVKNVRYLYSKLGTTDFSGISSTVSGALTTLNTSKAASTHNHDGVYSATNHTHSNYSTTGHTHNNYSTTGHTHSNYASSTHNHDTAYAAKSHTHSEYSTTGHTHSNYSTTGHTHSNYSTTGHTHSYIATSNIVTSQTNSTSKVPAASLVYSMNTTLSSLNDAMPNKLNIGDYGIGNKAITITNQNLLNYKVSGFYTGGNVTNAPDANWWYFEVISHDNASFVKYIAYPIYTNNNIYTARLENGTFSGWSVYDADAINGLQTKVNNISESAFDMDCPMIKNSDRYFYPFNTNVYQNQYEEMLVLKDYIAYINGTYIIIIRKDNLQQVYNAAFGASSYTYGGFMVVPNTNAWFMSYATGGNSYLNYFYFNGTTLTSPSIPTVMTNNGNHNYIIADGNLLYYMYSITDDGYIYTTNFYVYNISDLSYVKSFNVCNNESAGLYYMYKVGNYVYALSGLNGGSAYRCIYQINVDNKTATRLYGGNISGSNNQFTPSNYAPIYFNPDTYTVYCVNYSGNHIYKYDIRDIANTITDVFTGSFSPLYYLCNVSNNEVVFMGNNNSIYIFNFTTDQLVYNTSITTSGSDQPYMVSRRMFNSPRTNSFYFKVLLPANIKYIPLCGVGYLEKTNEGYNINRKLIYFQNKERAESWPCDIGLIFPGITPNSPGQGFLPYEKFNDDNFKYPSVSLKTGFVTRVGTGSSSSSTPCEITFNFVPKCIMCLGVKDTTYTGLQFPNLGASNATKEVLALTIWTDLLTTSYASYILGNTNYNAMGNFGTQMKKSEDGKTIYWYCTTSNNNARILNQSGYTYYFLAFGE